jgi:protein-disulfide isomerase
MGRAPEVLLMNGKAMRPTLALALVASVWPSPAAAQPAPPSAIYRLRPARSDASAGPDDASVTAIFFFSYQSPGSALVEDVLEERLARADGQLRVVWKHAPEQSVPLDRLQSFAAVAAQNQDRFLALHRRLMAQLFVPSPDELMALARQLGLDQTRFAADLASAATQARVRADERLARRLDMARPPLLVLDGRLYSGPITRAALERALDEATARAQALLASGVPRARLYETLTSDGRDPDATAARRRQTVNVSAADYTRGPARAPVTIVELSDFRCQPCRLAAAVVEMVRQKYPTKVRLVFKPLAILSQLAAEAALAAGEQGRFWEMHDLLFESQAPLDRRLAMSLALRLGLDGERFRGALDGQRFRARVARYLKEGQALGVTSTPTLFVNGLRFDGAPDVETLESAIDDELARR